MDQDPGFGRVPSLSQTEGLCLRTSPTGSQKVSPVPSAQRPAGQAAHGSWGWAKVF